MFRGDIVKGAFVGAGAAKTISIGFVPDMVILNNARGATETVTLSDVYQILKFDSGGTGVITAGDLIREATNGGTATVVDVAVTSGSWEAGTAAGFLVLHSVSGTIANDANLNIVAQDGRGAISNVATADGTPARTDVDIDTEAGTPAAEFVVPYLGSTTAAPGFTIAAGAAVSTELITWTAIRASRYVWG